MKLQRYPRYKPSGVEWLGDVPEHWEVKRGRFLFQVNPPAPRLTFVRPEDEVSFVPMDSVGVGGGLKLGQSRIRADVNGGYTEFQDGDVVVAKITPCFENGKAALASGLLNGVAYGTTELHVLRAKPTLVPGFLFYVAISHVFRQLGESEMYGAGGQKRVPQEFNKDYRTLLPPLSEQRAIAAFLDRETGRLDRLVAKKRELIERLKEKRAALISRTVTRGLPAEAAAMAGVPENPPLKPSGIEWLGEIPEHWQVRRLKDHSVLMAGAAFPHDEQNVEGEELPFYKVGDLVASSDGRFMGAAPNTVNRTTAAALRASVISSPAVIYAKIGAALLLNRRRITTRPCCIDNNMTACIPDYRKVVVGWLYYWLSALDFGEFLNPGAVPSFSEGYQSTLAILIPPLPEQAAIAAYLDEETAKLDALVEKVEEAVERLQEYRTALITAAVTGTIYVRRETHA